MRIRNGDPCSCPSASCTGDDSCSIDRPSSFPVQLLLVASQTFATFLCAKKAHEDYGEDLRKAICYVNGGGAIATPGG